MKYKITGIANYLVGGSQISIALTLFLFVIPRVQILYQEFHAEVSLVKSYLTPVVLVIFGTFNIFLGHKLFSSKNKLIEKYFTISIIYLVITLIITGFVTQLSILAILRPIYDLLY